MNLPTNWDRYFLNICDAVATKSPCLSRNIGAVLVQDKRIVATGFNGPPRGVPHCGTARNQLDMELRNEFYKTADLTRISIDVDDQCPRRQLGYSSGEGLHLCPATHAEANCIANAAAVGTYVSGTTLYLNTVIPCRDCLKLLINAGVSRIYPIEPVLYDKWSRYIIQESDIEIVGYEG